MGKTTRYEYYRGDRYAITLPVTKDNVAFDLTGWTTTCTLGQDDTQVAITETEMPGAEGRCTLTVQPGNGSATLTICNSTLLEQGYYDVELRAVQGPLVYTWPKWQITIAEPLGI